MNEKNKTNEQSLEQRESKKIATECTYTMRQASELFEELSCAYEILEEASSNEKLKNKNFFVSDCIVYRGEKMEPIMYLSKKNIALEDIENVKKKTDQFGFYHPSDDQVNEIVSLEDTLRINMDNLTIAGLDSGHAYLEFDSETYEVLGFGNQKERFTMNNDERDLIERIYGNGNRRVSDNEGEFSKEFKRNMRNISQGESKIIYVQLIRPDSVKYDDFDECLSEMTTINAESGNFGSVSYGRDYPFKANLHGKLKQM